MHINCFPTVLNIVNDHSVPSVKNEQIPHHSATLGRLPTQHPNPKTEEIPRQGSVAAVGRCEQLVLECGVCAGAAETRPRGGAAGVGVRPPKLVQRCQQDTAEVSAAVKGEKQRKKTVVFHLKNSFNCNIYF